jgi:hypothetical protein
MRTCATEPYNLNEQCRIQRRNKYKEKWNIIKYGVFVGTENPLNHAQSHKPNS